ncbi:MAG: ankyrin repeat domain-containing protein [Proteobacteria bacterium]|nr:ankyrin repeat domain-containing protein [Pseudomonadota bacterium]
MKTKSELSETSNPMDLNRIKFIRALSLSDTEASQAVKALLDEDVNPEFGNGWNALRFAIILNKAEALKVLLEKGVSTDFNTSGDEVNPDIDNALLCATRLGHQPLVQLLLEKYSTNLKSLTKAYELAGLLGFKELEESIAKFINSHDDQSDNISDLTDGSEEKFREGESKEKLIEGELIEGETIEVDGKIFRIVTTVTVTPNREGETPSPTVSPHIARPEIGSGSNPSRNSLR